MGIVTADDQANWVALEVGTLLEPLVARIFEAKTGLKVYQRKCMFQHPLYPWMLADLDYMVDLPDGTTAIVEIKTTNYNAKDKWWYNGGEIVPVYYESQGRHYMAVMNLDRVYYCCLYGNNEDEAIVRHENVLARIPPPYTEDGDLILESLRRSLGPAAKDTPAVVFSKTQEARVTRYLELQEEKRLRDTDVKVVETEMQRLKALIVADMGTSCTAVCEGSGHTVTWNPSHRVTIDKNGLERLKEVHPDIYAEYITVSESRRFSVKRTKPEAA